MSTKEVFDFKPALRLEQVGGDADAFGETGEDLSSHSAALSNPDYKRGKEQLLIVMGPVLPSGSVV